MKKSKVDASDYRNGKNKTILTNFLENQTDMPPISLSDMPYIEISGRNHIELDGLYKILEYKPERLKLRFRHCTVCFNGENMFIRNFSNKTAIVEGKLSSIEFE